MAAPFEFVGGGNEFHNFEVDFDFSEDMVKELEELNRIIESARDDRELEEMINAMQISQDKLVECKQESDVPTHKGFAEEKQEERHEYFSPTGVRMAQEPWEFFRRMGSPRHVVAPMVDQSELAYRMLCRGFGAQLCYTPMIHSRCFVEDANYRERIFDTCPEDRPLIVQFCGDNPDTLLAAARLVQDRCDAVDLNLGCPQGIARKGHYGAFLLEETDLVCGIVRAFSENLDIPVTCKIRLLPSLQDTLKLAQALQNAGCALLTVHGRTKEQNKQRTGTVDWAAISRIKQYLNIPVVANGGIACYADIDW